MKKINNLIILFALFIFLNDCAGYKPIFSSSNLDFEIDNHTLEGDKEIGNKILSKLINLSRSANETKNIRNLDVFLHVKKDKTATSKSSTGKILEYKITLETHVNIKDFLTDNEIINETITSSSSYKLQDQYSETVNLENKSVDDLINVTYQELLIKLSQNILIQ